MSYFNPTEINALSLGYLRHRATCTDRRAKAFRGRLGDDLVMCRGCGVTYPLEQLRALAARQAAADRLRSAQRVAREAASRPRYRLTCIDCEGAIHLHRARPVVPLCVDCKQRRTTVAGQ